MREVLRPESQIRLRRVCLQVGGLAQWLTLAHLNTAAQGSILGVPKNLHGNIDVPETS